MSNFAFFSFCASIASTVSIAIPIASATAVAQTIQFSDHGKAHKTLSDEEVQKLSPPAEIRVFEPHEEKEIEFRAIPLSRLLDAVYGEAWRKAGEILFVCADGYKAPVSVERISQHKAWLAFSRKDKPAFTFFEKDIKKEKELGPYFLVWDTIRDAEMKALGKQGWPYQVVGLDLIELADRYPALTPPADAPEAVRRGYKVFVKSCVSCHALDGQGGKAGPELNAPVSVTAYFKEAWLKKWIADPSSVRAGTTMPAPFAPGSSRDQNVDDVVAYLKAMAPKAGAKSR